MTYAARLAEAAEAAHAPRAPDAPTVISLFAGAGGSSTGYHMAGYRELLAVEWDPHAAETFTLNWPHVPLHHGDVAALSVDEVLRRTGLAPGELDVLDGSPPCQGFSTAGARQIDDPRNALYREFTRLLRGLAPKAFVMENVTGLVKGQMTSVFVEILADLKACGYRVECRKLRASHLGVPQARERMIFVGAREDLGRAPSLPAPATRPTSARAAFEDLPEDARRELDGLGLDIWTRLPPGRSFKDLHPKGHWFSAHKLDPDRPARTVTKTVIGKGAGGLYHWRWPRLLNLAEVRRLSSFPDDYRFPGDPATFDDGKAFMEAWARLGNAVPPLMILAVAEHVRRKVLGTIPPAPQEVAEAHQSSGPDL